MNDANRHDLTIEAGEDLHRAWFPAMACLCEILIDSADRREAERLAVRVAAEAHRIEAKYSRYRKDNIVHRINSSAGSRLSVDAETARLLDYAERCFRLSDGLFDVTSGILRQVWRFDGSDRLPDPAQVAQYLPLIGWDKVEWQAPRLRLPAGMEIDLGGIGKEYAVDRSMECLAASSDSACLINFGGDLRALPRADGRQWQVGVDTADAPGTASRIITLGQGALATSGDANRYLLKDGRRYSHILDPRDGWPVVAAPRSVTVAAGLCVEAGMLSSLAMLQGAEAEAFLDRQGVRYWIER